MATILNLLLFGSSFTVIIIALGFFTEKKDRSETIVVFAVCVLWAVNALFWMSEEYSYYAFYPDLLYINQPFEFFLGPLLYLRLQVLLEGKIKFDRLTALLFTPGVLAVLYFIPFFLQSPEAKLASVGFANVHNEFFRAIYLVILYGAAPWAVFCVFLSIVQGRRLLSRKGIGLIMQRKAFVACNLIFIGAIIALYAANVMKQKELLVGALFLINCLIIILYYFIKLYPDFFMAILKDTSEMKYKRSMVLGMDTEAVVERIQDLMERERLYLDDTLSLRSLSEALSITPHQLSEILNTRLNTGFRSLVNAYRINAAKRMMLEDDAIRILRVAYQCGFNSKNAFNNAFLKQEGMTPTEFKERHKKNGHGL
ncbi:MAG: AraC family transcriptional regulator [Spirochaetes bacterium]|nr:AraC family transcriptional regulator [Spirochaetota bacterium]